MNSVFGLVGDRESKCTLDLVVVLKSRLRIVLIGLAEQSTEPDFRSRFHPAPVGTERGAKLLDVRSLAVYTPAS